MEILQTNRGGVKLHLEGYLYVKKRDLLEGKIRWQCEKQRSGSCSGAITTNGPPGYGDAMGAVAHNHEPDGSRAQVLAIRAGMKRAAEDVNSGSTSQIVANALLLTPPNVREELGQIRSMSRDVQRHRCGLFIDKSVFLVLS